MMTLNASSSRRWYYRLRGKRHIRGGRWEKSAKGKKNLTLSPQILSLFPFLLSPTPFDACYAGYGIVISISLDWKKKKKIGEFSETSIFPWLFLDLW